MEPVILVILLALLEYMVFTALVGRARAACGIAAPATTGHPVFERTYRVHQNTLESLIVFVPAVWIFGSYGSAVWAAIIGAVFLVGRAVYAVGYLRAAEKRALGAMLSIGSNGVLVVAGLSAVIAALLGE